ncbi:hypothetical protein L6R52_35510 [Myxococcota bacterium]|nr:hypothetical protein [Myxococcota bacterium]
MMGPNAVSASALSKELRIAQPTLSKWLRDTVEAMKTPSTPPLPPAQWPLKARMRVVLEAEGLEGEELGALLRREGLTTADLEAWRKLGDAVEVSSGASDRKRIRELERDLKRKDRALAETAALLVLEKKLKQLWGTAASADEDESTTSRNDE